MQARLGETEWGQILLARAPDPENLERYLGRAGGTLAATLGWTLGGLANLAIVLFVAVYVAADPDTYRQGLLRLVPPASRPRAEEVLARLGATLQRWLIGQLIAMVTIGTAVAVGLTLLGVPLALALGLLAGLLNFVPYLGPVLAFVPAALLALTEGVPTLLWVLGLYALIQALESYVVTPLIQQQAVALPPALIILAQVLLAVTVGWLGLLLATPLTAAVVVVIDMLYVEARREPAAVRSPARLGRGGSGRAG
jgi:predicted PurR-regulated permease PerM